MEISTLINHQVCTGCNLCFRLTTENFYENKSKRLGYEKQCKACRKIRSDIYWAKKGRAQRYNLPNDGYQFLLSSQGGACAICKKKSDPLCVDHDHSTGAVRGLLCRSCNLAIGYLDDSPTLLFRSIHYLVAQ